MNETLAQNLAAWLTKSCHNCDDLSYCTVYDRDVCPFYQGVKNYATCHSITVEQWLSVLQSMTQADGGAATESDHDAHAKRGIVLLEALNVINGERQDEYGNPEDCFDVIALFWNEWLRTKLITRYDVAMMMALLKIARENHLHKADNIVDACGYLALARDMMEGKAKK